MRLLLIALCVVVAALLITACSRSAKREEHKEHADHTAARGDGHPHLLPHRFNNPEAWAARWETPERDAWQKPDEVVAALNLPIGAKVADVGAGTGYFATRLARAVPDGKVFASDLEPEMVEYLQARAVREGLRHMTAVQADEDDANLPEQVDLVLMVNTHHHISERPAYFRKLAEDVAPRGRIAIIDYRPDAPMGPPPEHRLPADAVERDLSEAGFRVVERHAFLPHQYFLVFSR